MFPGPRIRVLGVSVFCKGCDLKLFKEPYTFWGSISELSITSRFFLDTIMKHLFADWSCPLICAPLDPDEALDRLPSPSGVQFLNYQSLAFQVF